MPDSVNQVSDCVGGPKSEAPKHTPGRWELCEVGVSDAGPNGVPVYEVVAVDCGWTTVCEYVSQADARLIAAAPELLDALIRARDHVPSTTADEVFDAVDAAIRKALGESA